MNKKKKSLAPGSGISRKKKAHIEAFLDTRPDTEISPKNVRIAERLCFQGDVCFVRMGESDVIPSEYVLTKTGDRITVAHSETGHNHDVLGSNLARYENPADPMVSYLSFGGGHADAIHLREFDKHETWRLLGGLAPVTTYKVIRQREYTPEGFRRVED